MFASPKAIQQLFTRTTANFLRNAFATTRKRRVRQLGEEKVSLEIESNAASQVPQTSVFHMERQKLVQTDWQNLPFDKLCSLPTQIMRSIEAEVQLDKFNVKDEYFYAKAGNIATQNTQNLTPFYERVYYLLKNENDKYDEKRKPIVHKNYYLAEMLNVDLTKDAHLTAILNHFVQNVDHPLGLQAVAEPSFCKKLLTLKRELILQGMRFSTKQSVKLKTKDNKTQVQQKEINGEEFNVKVNEQQQANEIEEEEQQFNFHFEEQSSNEGRIRIQSVLGYQYEFWVDVKHNRNKNGIEQDYIIEQRVIQNPNNSSYSQKHHPTVKVKYLVHKKKRKEHSLHFCFKADLLIKIDGKHDRHVKVEWDGPSSKPVADGNTNYIVIDFEGLMSGNPTIKPVFAF